MALKDLVDAKDFLELPVVTCDNIEVAKNEEGRRSEAIREVYEKFFKEYLAAHAEQLRVDPSRVVAGLGYTPQELRLRKIPNHYVPQAPMGYSDNVHETCYAMETGLPQTELKKMPPVRPLTERDALSAAYIEGKAYADNDSLMEYLHKVQNNIIGMRIANQYFGRPNLSFLARGKAGMPSGYLIAYEGGEQEKGMIYISDLAADPEDKMAGVLLVRNFLRSYFEHYGVGDRPFIPVYTNAREKTSYRWIMKLAQAEAKKHGVIVELEEAGTYEQGPDTMHNILIYIGKNQEEIERQKQGYRNLAEYQGGGYEEAGEDAKEENW
jgi:hypothetical protein